MHCDVYKFPKSPDWYVYIARTNYPNDVDEIRDWLEVLPSEVHQQLGLGELVMHLDLSAREKLASVDIDDVRAKLAVQGYYIQVPPADVLAQQALIRAKTLQDKKYD
ncbi:MAG: YcgL domain-containing protein [Moraxella sp.]|nr:YcgL domain-containing protein [Moraxella sp.]